MQENYSLYKSVILVALFMIFTPITLIISVFSLLMVSVPKDSPQVLAAASPEQNGVHIFASLPKELPSVEAQVEVGDARSEIVRQYLARYGSPLETYADFIVNVADENGIDFRLITAIAQQESNLCKFIPDETYNCWGWGIHSRGTLGFDSYQEGILTVSQGLKQEYIDKGFVTVEDIMTKYTPSSNGSWANGVSLFMSEMQ